MSMYRISKGTPNFNVEDIKPPPFNGALAKCRWSTGEVAILKATFLYVLLSFAPCLQCYFHRESS